MFVYCLSYVNEDMWVYLGRNQPMAARSGAGLLGRSGVRRGRDSEEDLVPSLIRKGGGKEGYSPC